MPTPTISLGQAFQQDMLDLLLCREAQDFIDNESSYANEPEDYIQQFKDYLNNVVSRPCLTAEATRA